MKLIPQKDRWQKWSLPSKFTVLSFYLAIIIASISLISFTSIKLNNYFSSVFWIKEIKVNEKMIEKKTNGTYKEYDGYIEISYPRIMKLAPNQYIDKINREIEKSAISYLEEHLIEYVYSYSVGLKKREIISIKMEQYYYYFMAMNGNSSIKTININPITQSIIDFYDIFDVRRNALIEIKKIIGEKLIEKHGGYFEDKLNKGSFIPRFFLKDNSIEFVFSKYEVTPGVADAPFVEIQYIDLLDFIRHDGPLGYLLPVGRNWEAADHFVKGIIETVDRLRNDSIFDWFESDNDSDFQENDSVRKEMLYRYHKGLPIE
ncbi:RsiV family protein [Natronoflexus pectinivorans]|uniref:Uncharacterized protein DUF3298 n=1 Tax=Natronoflexus pectinivorans TaxID=682526 RepID=A0A4R2G3C4_9BACT|nr:RsiV family protein [Natronoflexus pectinivorans]TCO01719.1 uncharacterized protein DUF3298 [Natronoflexus pectinivorans]